MKYKQMKMENRWLLALVVIFSVTSLTNAFTLSLRRVKKEETTRLFNIKFYKELLNNGHDTSSANDLTCFTCGKTSSNDECNKNAVDEPCAYANTTQINQIACMTIYTYDHVEMKTISIEKMCAQDCTPQMVGCSIDEIRHTTACKYCCNKNYCNMDVAQNEQQALSLAESLFAKNRAGSNFHLIYLKIFININWLFLLFFFN